MKKYIVLHKSGRSWDLSSKRRDGISAGLYNTRPSAASAIWKFIRENRDDGFWGEMTGEELRSHMQAYRDTFYIVEIDLPENGNAK